MRPCPRIVRHRLLFALVWFSAMPLLFSSFSIIGVLLGNIVQSTRGVLPIVLGWLIAHAGFEHLEKHTAQSIALRRIAAAQLMSAAISLFHLGGVRG